MDFKYSKRVGPLPPGTKIEFGSTEGVAAFEEVAASFLKEIFGYRPGEYLLTDESRLSDFVPINESIEPVIRKINDTYHIDIVPSSNPNLLQLFQELVRNLVDAKTTQPPIWTIYDHPADYPQHFVVRVWYGLAQEFHVEIFSDLASARRHVLKAGASINLHRRAEDKPAIVESWI